MKPLDVCISGMGIVSALGSGCTDHVDAIVQSKTGLSKQSFFENAYAAEFICGPVSQKICTYSIEESAADRANIFCEIASRQALHQACVTNAAKEKVDVVIGTTSGNFHGASRYYAQKRSNGNPNVSLVANFVPASVADRTAAANSLLGKLLTVSSACASGTTAIGRAFRMIKNKRAQCVLAGGVDVLCPFIVAGFNSLRLLSKKHCSPFDANRDGFNPGEACAMVVVETVESALSRGAVPLARICGYGEGLEAFHHTRSNPDGTGIASVVKKAIESADMSLDRIDHIHCHGTATQFNDMSEYNGLKLLFGDSLKNIPVCSSKSMTGHTLGAAGALSAILAILCMQNSIVPATLFHNDLDPQFADLFVQKTPLKKDLRRVCTTSLGFGGETASLILERADL